MLAESQSRSVLVQGTPISLDSSGLLIIGTSTAILAAKVTPPPPPITTIDGQITSPKLGDPTADGPMSLGQPDAQIDREITAFSSVFIIGGQTMTANPSALAVAGQERSAQRLR